MNLLSKVKSGNPKRHAWFDTTPSRLRPSLKTSVVDDRMKLFPSLPRTGRAKKLSRQIDELSNRLAQSEEAMRRQGILTAAGIDACRRPPRTIRELGYQVFSQFDDDGIISYLTQYVEKDRRSFIEFGVEDYMESNTRLLLEKSFWKGMVIDGSSENIAAIESRPDHWRFNLTAKAAFIDRDNINDLIRDAEIEGDIGLLSVDIDGNDFWVWQAIQCVRPAIVVCEYNAIFGDQWAVTVPYRADFQRSKAHESHLYAGGSLAAMNHLAVQRGLEFVGCNSAGNNAYFVDPALNHGLPRLSVRDGFVDSQFRESRNQDGTMRLRTASQSRSLVEDLPAVDVVSGKTIQLKEIFESSPSAESASIA